MNRREEQATAAGVEKFGSASITAFRSLARSRRVSLATVLAAAEDGDLIRVVEMRDYGAADRIAERNHARLMYLQRMRLLSILSDRDLMLRERELH